MIAEPVRIARSADPAPPKHLSAAMRRWWRQIVRGYVLEAHHVRLLEGAATAWDRAQAARLMVEAEGSVYRDRFGQPKEHPAAHVERQSLVTFARLTRELGLDPEAAASPRPPTRWR